VEGLPATQKDLEQSGIYIHNTARHYRSHAALDSWILINEPGWIPKVDPLSSERFRSWLETRYLDIGALNAAWRVRHASFAEVTIDVQAIRQVWAHPAPFVDWFAFSRFHLTFQLQSWADALRAEDADHPIHVNPHGLVANLASMADDLLVETLPRFTRRLDPSVMAFLALRPEQFPLGVAYVCSLIQGASEPAPFWTTELQGGNNIYSSVRPLCPRPKTSPNGSGSALAQAPSARFLALEQPGTGVRSRRVVHARLPKSPTERLETASASQGSFRNIVPFLPGQVGLRSVTILLSLER